VLGRRGGRAGGLLHGHGLGIPLALGGSLLLGGLEPAEDAVVEHFLFLLAFAGELIDEDFDGRCAVLWADSWMFQVDSERETD